MITIYDLLEVDEKASKEEIEKAYLGMIVRYGKDPSLTPEENEQSEVILNKLKMAYDILMDDDKRAKYDKQLSQKKAEELLKNVSAPKVEAKEPEAPQEEIRQAPIQKVEEVPQEKIYEEPEQEYVEQEENLTNDEKKKLRKAAQKEFNNNLKKAQKAEEEYNKAYNEAYNNYLRKMGYKVKEPLRLKRVKNLVITILVIIGFCLLIWFLPPTRNFLINIYNENFIVKSLVDIIAMLIDAIVSTFKG